MISDNNAWVTNTYQGIRIDNNTIASTDVKFDWITVPGVEVTEYGTVKEELVQLRTLLQGCMVCGDGHVFMLCDECRQVIMDSRKKKMQAMLTDLLEFERENAHPSGVSGLPASMDT